MMNTITLKNIKRLLNEDILNQNCVLFCGAGISMIKPSNLPSGNELKNQILTIICSEKYNSSLNRAVSNPHFRKLIPEVMFQILHDVCSSKTFEFFKLLDSDNYNNIHFNLASIQSIHCIPIYTTNFDCLIEKSIKKRVEINHLHGALDDLNGLMSIITRIDKGVEGTL